MTYQTTIEGIREPLPSETEYGAMVLRLADRFGIAWVWKHAHWLHEGEQRAIERAQGLRTTKEIREAA